MQNSISLLKNKSEPAMDLRVLLVADYANVTREGKLNVMGRFTNISARQFPAVHPEMWLIAMLSAAPAEYNTTRKLTVKLLNEDATVEIMNWSRDITVPQGTAGRRVEMNQIVRLAGLVFPSEGAYQFSFLVDNDEKGTLVIDLLKIEE